MLLHFVLPLAIALTFFRPRWKFAYLIMMATTVVDIDHLLATPIYDPLRCSVGFHPLHRLIPIAIYVLLSFIPKTRLAGIGLVIHKYWEMDASFSGCFRISYNLLIQKKHDYPNRYRAFSIRCIANG
jgi:hypothetical protein